MLFFAKDCVMPRGQKINPIFALYLKYTLLLTACLLHFECKAEYSQYVWAKNGLTLRTAPSKTGEKIKTLPYEEDIKKFWCTH